MKLVTGDRWTMWEMPTGEHSATCLNGGCVVTTMFYHLGLSRTNLIILATSMDNSIAEWGRVWDIVRRESSWTELIWNLR